MRATSSRSIPAGKPKRFFTVAETADLLGVSVSTLHRAVRAGEFPAIKVRGRYVIPAKAIDEMESSALLSGLTESADHTTRRAA